MVKVCFECGAQGATQEHHVVPRSLGGTRTVPLCGACHGVVHGLPLENHGVLIAEGLRKARAAGRRPGPAPFGWTKDKAGRVAACGEQQTALALGRKLHAAGLSWAAAARELRRKGHACPKNLKVAIDRSDELWAELGEVYHAGR